jgi:hypothetical protein
MPEGTGFSRRLRDVQDQPGPENVERADLVGMPEVAAPLTAELGLSDPVLPCAVPALGARAGGVAGFE